MIDKRQRKCFSRKSKIEALVKEEEENTNRAVKFIRLFHFASRNDAILISASVMASILNGVCLPLMVLLWGDLSNIIVENYDSGTNKTDTNTTTCQSSTNFTQNVPMFTYLNDIFYSASSHSSKWHVIFSPWILVCLHLIAEISWTLSSFSRLAQPLSDCFQFR